MPDSSSLIADLREMVARPKQWTFGNNLDWIEAAGKPGRYEIRAGLEVDGTQPEGLFFNAFFAPMRIAGTADKMSLTLVFQGVRVLGIDTGDMSGHRNTVGIGRPYYGQRIGCPHLHTVSDDAAYGYAEPLPSAPLPGVWTDFMLRAKIDGAPPLVLPTYQMDLLP